jgi:HAD superfamily phosphoserine phosphatase-like hydrolase
VIRDHLDREHRIYLISGSFTPVVVKLAEHLGLHGAIATPLEVVDGCYTGKIISPLNVGEGKIVRLQHFLEESGQDLDLSRSFFYTDSIVDAPVMEIFGHPIAVYPDKPLEALAKKHGWRIIA